MSETPLPDPGRSAVNATVTATAANPVGVVVIGRNEGERLRHCLESVVNRAAAVVYTDSGSTDGSVALAESLGVEVVELDLSVPFTAARARNEGFVRLQQVLPEVAYVQMVDGDCEVVEGWLETAVAYLEANPKFAVACGRRRERFPDATVYNRLADMEWDTPIGMAQSCGGDALFRSEALREVGGYNPKVIAGEEPEMCVRLRQAGWLIERLDAEMTLHDANMTSFNQWWKRNVRAGHAYAQGAHMHGKTDGHNVKQVRSIAFWGMAVPTGIVITSTAGLLITLWGIPSVGLVLVGLAILGVMGFVLLALKVQRYRRRLGDDRKSAAIYGDFTAIGKLPNAIGVCKFHWNRLRNKQSILIEYKPPAEGGIPA